jgi:hypothetical protein
LPLSGGKEKFVDGRIFRIFKPTRKAAFGCAALLAAMHHGRFNAYAAYALLSLLIVLVVFLLLQTS